MDNVSLGELIRKKRKEKQMTQGELASLLYVSTNAISKWELGKNSIDSQNREKLAELLDIPHTLLFDEPPEIPNPTDSLTNTDTTGFPPPSPEIDESIPPEPAALPVTITEKKTGLKMIPFILLAIGCILITATFIVCSMRLKNRDSFSIQDEYFDVYEGESACYLIAEYSGEFTVQNADKYTGMIREKYADCFNEVDTIVVLFYQNYSKSDIISCDTADVILVLNPDPF